MADPLRIAFVAPFGLGQKTTVWARTLPLARALAAQGHQATVLIPPWDTAADAGQCWVDHGVAVKNVATAGGPAAILARLLAELRQFPADVIHIVKPRAYAGLVQWWLWQAQRLRPAPYRLVLDVDDWEQAWAEVNSYPRLLARFLAWQEEWGLRHAAGITAASQWLVARAGEYAPHTPVLYLPNGVDFDAPLPPEQEAGAAAGRRVLFFSRFVEVSPDWLADFWLALSSRHQAAILVVAGKALQPAREAAYSAALRRAAPAAWPRVQWLGYVQPHRLADLYASADCAIFPAANTPLHQAKCSVRLATTLLHGVPVVASAVGEQAAYGAAGAARLVPAAATPAEFAEAVSQVLGAPIDRSQMRLAARQRLRQHYEWADLGWRLNDFYTKILGGGGK